jgi:peptide deformylase
LLSRRVGHPEIERLVRDMAETMYAAPGIGPATQVNVHKRVIVMDISKP